MSPSPTPHQPRVQPHDAATPAFSPLYRQIKVLITQDLQAGEWKPGEAIPSEIELAARFKVSQGTVRKAIDELAAENLLVRRQGKGTFVATHAEQTTQYRFLRLARRRRQRPAACSAACSTAGACAPAPRSRAPLELKSGDPVVQCGGCCSTERHAGRARRHLAARAACSRA